MCLCAPLDGKFGFYGLPLKLIPRHGLDNVMRQAAIKSAFLQIDELMEANRVREAIILDDCERTVSPIEEACQMRGATMNSYPVAYVDLAAGPASWRAALRKSSRSLINWGRRHLSMRYVNKDTPDRGLFDQYRAFHADVAGRVTRSDVSWAVMYDWITRGGGELAMAFLEERPVAGSMFIDGSEMSFYTSGVYDRMQFDKPLAHYPVWLSIERAHARGMKRLRAGRGPLERDRPGQGIPDRILQAWLCNTYRRPRRLELEIKVIMLAPIASIYRLILPEFRLRFFSVVGLSIIVAIFEMVGIASIMPLIAVMVDPAGVANNRLLSTLLGVLGSSGATPSVHVIGFITITLIILTNVAALVLSWISVKFSAQLAVALSEQFAYALFRRPFEVLPRAFCRRARPGDV